MPDESQAPANPLAEIAQHLAPTFEPMLVNTLLPALRADTALQDRVGAAIGKSIADEYRTQVNLAIAALIAIAVALSVIAITATVKAFSGDE